MAKGARRYINQRRELKEIIKKGDYAIISAEKNNLNDEQNKARTFELRKDIEALGYKPLKSRSFSDTGFEDSPFVKKFENPYIIYGITEKQALDLGVKYNQESIIYGNKRLSTTQGEIGIIEVEYDLNKTRVSSYNKSGQFEKSKDTYTKIRKKGKVKLYA